MKDYFRRINFSRSDFNQRILRHAVEISGIRHISFDIVFINGTIESFDMEVNYLSFIKELETQFRKNGLLRLRKDNRSYFVSCYNVMVLIFRD